MRTPRLVVLGLVVLAVLPGCAKKDKTVDLSLKRITLDLSFKDPSKVKPATVGQILAAQEPLSAPVQVLGDLAVPTPKSVLGPLLPSGCRTAPAGSLPAVPVSGVVGKPPTAGVYLTHDKGSYSLDGPVKLKGDVLPFGAVEIAHVTDETGPATVGGTERRIEFDVIERSLLAATTTRYRSIVRERAERVGTTSAGPVANELQLVSSETKVGGSTTTFTPDPPVTVMQYGGEGSTWHSAGVDQSTGTSMVVDGTITAREAVDLCGTMVGTYRVESNERVTNALTQYSSQTDSDHPNVYNVATQFGGLFVRRITNTTTNVVTEAGAATLTIHQTSTFDSITPVKK